MSTSSLISNLQSTIDFISKKREESGYSRSDDGVRLYSSHSSELQERVSNVERSIIHILTRLDRVESASRKPERGYGTSDELLSNTERMLREVMVELLKQQNLVDMLRQENESLKERLAGKKETPSYTPPPSSSSTQPASKPPTHAHTPHTQARPQEHQAQPQAQPSTQAFNRPQQLAAKPPTAAKKSPAPVPKSSAAPRRDDEHEAEADVEPPHKRLPVEFPPGYNTKRGRRFSVAGESYNPNTDFTNLPRNIIKKSPDARNRIRTVITNNILFKNLDEDQLEDLIDEMFEVRQKPDEVIIRQGDDGDNFYVVDSGELYVLYKDVVVATIGVGKGFGEIALMYMCPRTATVKAKTDCILWAMSRATFRRSLMVHAIRKRELYESFLARVPLLAELLPYERSIIADALESRSFKDGELIIREGEKGDAFYIVEKGKTVVTKGNPPVEVKTCTEGDYFGELALLTDQPRAANVCAVGPVRVLYLRREDFAALMGPCEEILKRNTEVYNQINAKLAKSETKTKPQSLAALAAEVSNDESSYLQGLQLLQKEFIKPMHKAAETKSLPISPEEVGQLFLTSEMLVTVHNMLMNEFTELSRDPSSLSKILKRAEPGLQFHSAFISEWDSVQQVYDQYKNDKTFQGFLKAPGRAQADLYELLRASRDRIQTFIGYLKDFQAFVPNDREAHEVIEKLQNIS